MAQLILTAIRRDDTIPGLWLNLPIEIRFANATVWGPYLLQPGTTIDLSAPLPLGVPQANSSPPFNDSGMFQILIHWGSFPLLIPTRSDPVDAFSQSDGFRVLSVPGGNTIYTVHYSLIEQRAKLIA
jgi:hypothetical protein